MDGEADLLKRIDLRMIAEHFGFRIDIRESSRSSTVMRHAGNGDKIVIKLDGSTSHYVYFSVRQDDDNGTAFDFIQNRTGKNFGQARKELRELAKLPNEPARFPVMMSTTKDRFKVEAAVTHMSNITRHAYLEDRGIPKEIFVDKRFAGRIRCDTRGNAIGLHRDAFGICGFEVKNRGGYTRFFGTKGLFSSRANPDDTEVYFYEAFIDALSLAALEPRTHARYISVAGNLNAVQPDLIHAAIASMPPNSRIFAAFDADTAGAKLVEIVRGIVESVGRVDLTFMVHVPETGEKDWNEVLQKRPKPISANQRQEPFVV